MNREQAIGLARKHAAGSHHAYCEPPFMPHDWVIAAIREAGTPSVVSVERSIDMVLYCPKCGEQHIDAPWTNAEYAGHLHESPWWELGGPQPGRWTNPPHRSHLCHGCGHIWRPADVPTNGVVAIKTKGKHDSPPAFP